MPTKIPCTVITGFLGAGKTTLIQSLIANPQGRRIALIVNEFGTLGVDGDLVRSCGIEGCDEDDVIELANGCICCTVADDFLPTLTILLDRPQPPDHILIETSGLALPQPLLRAFAWPEVRTRVTVDGVITVIDAEAVAAGHFAHDEAAVREQQAADESLDHESPLAELFEDQLSCADLVVLTKTDLIDETALARVEQTVREAKRDAAKIIYSGLRRPPADVLLGLSIAAENEAHQRRTHHEAHHADDPDHDHDDFDSFVVQIPQSGSVNEVEARIAAVSSDPRVLRVKGAVTITGKPMRLVVQAVGPRVSTHFDRRWRDDETDRGHLVVIGRAGVSATEIAAKLQGKPR